MTQQRSNTAKFCFGPLSIPQELHPLQARPSGQFTMSDFEDDEMDVDAPAVQSAINFSSSSANKGKRSAANLPVEAEDSLPW